jgi:hypothetical protein
MTNQSYTLLLFRESSLNLLRAGHLNPLIIKLRLRPLEISPKPSKWLLLSVSTQGNQLTRFRVTHFFQPGENLIAIHQHSQLALLGSAFNIHFNFFKVFLKFSGKTCRQLLLASGCTVLD